MRSDLISDEFMNGLARAIDSRDMKKLDEISTLIKNVNEYWEKL